MPTKGLPLPFISYGGTSLLVSLFMAGVLGNISARNPEPRDLAWWVERGRGGRGANRHVDKGPRLVVETGASARRRRSRGVPAEVTPVDSSAEHAGPPADVVLSDAHTDDA